MFHGLYHPRGTCPAREFVFPYPDRSFDFAVVSSVFTHMLPEDVEKYLRQTARILRDGGRCLASVFLINPESTALMKSGRAVLDFRHEGTGYRSTNPSRPEEAIAYEESGLGATFRRAGLRTRTPIHYGSWCGREVHLSFVDLVVAARGVAAGSFWT